MINLKTAYADMHREFWHEYDRQEYWVSKWSKRNRSSLGRLIGAALLTESKLIERVEYNKKNGNRWINYIYANPVVNGRTAFEYHSVCYWEGYGSFGTFSAYRCKGEDLLLISTTHYWQRYCERTKAVMQGVHTAMDFYCQHPSCEAEILPPAEGDTRRQICIHYTCGAAYGVEVSAEYHIFELRTFIDNASMTGPKARHHKEVLTGMDSDNVNKGIAQIQSILEQNKGMQIGSALEHISHEYRDETFLSIADNEEKIIQERMKELRKTLTHEQAVEEYMKDPMWESIELPSEVMRLHIATNDLQYLHDCADEGFNAFNAYIEQETGMSIPSAHKKTFRGIYNDGFDVSKDVMTGYIANLLGLDPRFKERELKPLQEYKHDEYLKMKEFYEKTYSDQPKESVYAITQYNARGFDDGMKCVAAMVKQYLGLNVISMQKE